MTSKDKTGDQLVASIRKSKSGAVSHKTSTRSNASKAAAKSTTKTASRPAKKTARSSTKAKPKSAKSTSQSSDFSFGQRVWPD